jgi:hypothetical protein
MACSYTLDLDQFLPLASETIGCDFSTVRTHRLRPPHSAHANDGNQQSWPALDLEFLANESRDWSSSPQFSPVSPSQALSEDRRRSRHQSTPSGSPAAREAAQLRRKEQNRAAQQAYRKRKEDLIRSLEIKIERLESTTSNLRVDNARLQSALHCLKAENEYLQSASSSAASTPHMSRAQLPSRSI